MKPVTYLWQGLAIKIMAAPKAVSPRSSSDNIARILCFHPRYPDLGDSTTIKREDSSGWSGLLDIITDREMPIVIEPLELQDASEGLRLATGLSTVPGWERAGFIFVPALRLPDLGFRRNCVGARRAALSTMADELDTYNLFLHGTPYRVEVWGGSTLVEWSENYAEFGDPIDHARAVAGMRRGDTWEVVA